MPPEVLRREPAILTGNHTSVREGTFFAFVCGGLLSE